MPTPVAGTAMLVEDLLGSTLSSVVKAQGLIASQLAEFVERVGFEARAEGDESPMRARTFSFEFTRAEVGEGDVVVTRRVTATLPLLSIVNLPALTIETADIGMDLRLVATEQGPGPGPGPFRPPVGADRPLKLWAVTGRAFSPTVPAHPGTQASASGTVNVRVTLKRMDVPLGLERIERLLADGYLEHVADDEV